MIAAKSEPCSHITPLGKAMACFPVSPRYGKMLALGHQHALLPYVVALVAALSVPDVFTDVQQLAGTDEQVSTPGKPERFASFSLTCSICGGYKKKYMRV